MKPIRLFIAGDSTAASYPQERSPMAGWGQMIGRYFNDSVVVVNEARNGRSSKSFINEGHLIRITDAMQEGDYLLIQFGHNDQKPEPERRTEPFGTYQMTLQTYINAAKSVGATPVLLTPVQRRQFNEEGTYVQSHGDYPEAVRQLAQREGVACIDLCTLSEMKLVSLGPDGSKSLFVWLRPGEHPNYPDGCADNTHFNERGAGEMALLVREGLIRAGLPISTYFTQENGIPHWVMPEVLLPDIPDRTFRLTDFGAVGDGLTDNTNAFHRAIQACTEAGGGKLIIPAGLWLTGPLKLASRLELHAEEGAVIRFSQTFADYPLIQSTYEGLGAVRCQSPLDAEGQEHIAITGKGVFDGGGEAWRPVKKWKMTEPQWVQLLQSGGITNEAGDMWWPSEAAMQGAVWVDRLSREGVKDVAAYMPARDYLRPNLLSFRRCRHILLDGPTFQNSAAWCLHPWASEHVTIRNVTVRNPWYGQNGDGLDLESCRYAVVEHCTFDVGDDAICLKSGKDEAGRKLGLPCEYVAIKNCVVYHGHGGFTIGSEMSGGVRYVSLTDCTFIGTDIGLRFKSARGRGGIVEHISIQRIRMIDIIGEAISFNFFYEGKEGSGTAQDEIEPVNEGTPIFRSIEIIDVVCTGAQTALLINGLPEMPLEQLYVHKLTAAADRGCVCHHAKQLVLEQMDLHVKDGSLITLHQCEKVELIRLQEAGAAADKRNVHITGAHSAAANAIR
ncbi:DNA sulfur modification protein DndE [Paenibacillus sp. V4I3]|uniref:glycosyl hydrolase family 28 protein n=1 Tax=Paenibacillus sp. V4I3 TaxID=3042305 RepID=UPI002787F883|nr:glycosyl hydrolase family 28 protein [Paenibacillus sp. V4I3]MDQ0871553.1 DNA sulfur modification protein DndE [Paenibacillus sp. V4I3]